MLLVIYNKADQKMLELCKPEQLSKAVKDWRRLGYEVAVQYFTVDSSDDPSLAVHEKWVRWLEENPADASRIKAAFSMLSVLNPGGIERWLSYVISRKLNVSLEEAQKVKIC